MRLRRAIALMLVSQVVMLGAIFSIYFVPGPTAILISGGLYSALWIAEARAHIASPITRLMVGFYSVLFILRVSGIDPAMLVYVPSGVYLILASLTLGLLLMGKPFTAFYAKGSGFYPLHLLQSGMWGVLHLLSAVAAWVLIPSIGFILVPMGFMVIGSIGTIWMNFFSMGNRFDRKIQFEMNGFRFCQVVDQQDRERFTKLVAELYRADLQRHAKGQTITSEKITKEQISSDQKREATLIRFLAFEQARAVGAICIYFSHPTFGLPIEGESGLDLSSYRLRGRIAEIGRLAIASSHRLNPSVLKGLLKCVVEAALQRFICVIFNDAFAFQQRLYEKIGFTALLPEPYISEDKNGTGYGLSVMPMIMDLEKMVGLDTSTVTSAEMRYQLNPYVIERFFKRLTLRQMVAHPKLLFFSRQVG